MTLARRALQDHRAEEAQGILVNLVVREPRNEEAWVLLAQTFGDLERRMECLQQARQANPFSSVIADAIQQLKIELLNAAFGTPPAAPSAVSTPDSVSSNPELAQTLLDSANSLAQAILMATEPIATRNFGLEFVHLLERAHTYDATLTRRWVNTAGRAALVKYERAITQLLTNLPQNDAQVATLRAQRQRALDFFK
ncbi:MAG: hypothetical protein HY780_12780 [Chloroflexi bacterium]|nr:hypothetical protein [Chloroflexota bacterium]